MTREGSKINYDFPFFFSPWIPMAYYIIGSRRCEWESNKLVLQ